MTKTFAPILPRTSSVAATTQGWTPPMDGPPVLGIDVGGTKTAVIVATPSGEVLERTQFPSGASRGFEPMFQDICENVQQTLDRNTSMKAIGVSIGGPIDSSTGTVFSPPHLPGWDAVPLRSMLEEKFGLETHVEHDAKAGALAEWGYGAARGVDNAIFLTLGTGLGSGVISGGRLLQGAGNAAGEIGHWRVADDGPTMYGKAGSLEGQSSGAGLAALAHYRHPEKFGPETTAKDVAERARAGDLDAQAVIAHAGEKLGHSLALMVDLLAPDVVVLGSLARRVGEPLLGPAMQTLQREALPSTLSRCEVVHSQLGEKIGDVAALSAALYHGG